MTTGAGLTYMGRAGTTMQPASVSASTAAASSFLLMIGLLSGSENQTAQWPSTQCQFGPWAIQWPGTQ